MTLTPEEVIRQVEMSMYEGRMFSCTRTESNGRIRWVIETESIASSLYDGMMKILDGLPGPRLEVEGQ